MFKDKKILLGVTGSIAAYKSAELASKLVQKGAEVQVLMTIASSEFIGTQTFSGLTGRKPLLDFFAEDSSHDHIGLSKWADIMIIAPATANMIAKLAQGIADDVISSTALSMVNPVLVAPAMNTKMYKNSITQSNIGMLWSKGYRVIEPEEGFLACGDKGTGRLPATGTLMEAIGQELELKISLANKQILVISGPTIEPLDPVRYISNYSSGKMGQAVAVAAARAGGQVTMITGPTNLPEPYGVNVIQVKTAEEMLSNVKDEMNKVEVIIMAAAVADFRPEIFSKKKIKKEGQKKIEVTLLSNPDILKEITTTRKKQYIVGFAAETGNLRENAIKKLKEKNLDLIVANDITLPGQGFGSDYNSVLITDGKEIKLEIDNKPKTLIAKKILQIISEKISK